jgi:hypothetical protein
MIISVPGFCLKAKNPQQNLKTLYQMNLSMNKISPRLRVQRKDILHVSMINVKSTV